MHIIPDATEPNDAEVQDDLAASSRPRHPRALESLREDHFAGRLGDPTADGQMLPPVGLIPHPPTALVERRIGLRIKRGLAP